MVTQQLWTTGCTTALIYDVANVDSSYLILCRTGKGNMAGEGRLMVANNTFSTG